MLRRLNVRTRLMAVIAVPLVLLFAVAGPEVLDRRDDAASADRAATFAADAQQLAASVDALQAERTLSAARRAGAGAQVEAGLADQRAATDTVLDRARPSLERLAGDAFLATPATAAIAELEALDLVRSDTDDAESEVPWNDPFAGMVGALLDVQDALGTATTEGGVGSELAVLALLSRAKDATSNQAA